MELLIGFHNFHSAFKRLPSDIKDDQGKPILSWRVDLLQMVAPDLFQRFRLNESWDSPHNKALLASMPLQYALPTDREPDATRILRPIVANQKTPSSFTEIQDKLDQTIALLVSDSEVPWTKPTDHAVDQADPWKGIARHTSFGFYDGSVFEIDQQAVGKNLISGFTIAGSDGSVPTKEQKSRRSFRRHDEAKYVAAMQKDIAPRLAKAGLRKDMVSQFHPREPSGAPLNAKEVNALISSSDAYLVTFGLQYLKNSKAKYDWQTLKPLLTHPMGHIRVRAKVLIFYDG